MILPGGNEVPSIQRDRVRTADELFADRVSAWYEVEKP